MRLVIRERQIKISKENREDFVVDVGYLDIREKGTSMVDEIIESIIHEIESEDVAVICPDYIECTMISRKIEDKIKREVQLIHPLDGTEY